MNIEKNMKVFASFSLAIPSSLVPITQEARRASLKMAATGQVMHK